MLVSLIPPHIGYVEPFCGAAHVFFAKPVSKIEVLNDLDGELMNFFRCAQTVPEALSRAAASMPYSRRLYSLLRKADRSIFDPIQCAAHFVYDVHRSFGGVPGKGFATARVGSGGAIRSTAKIADGVRACAARLDRVILECLDWRDCLEKYDAATTLFYIDPPYLSSDVGYAHVLTEQDHIYLADRLKKLRGKWILTVGDSPLMRELYTSYSIRRISTAQSLKRGRRGRFKQLIVLNF